jgi:response regulator NasT
MEKILIVSSSQKGTEYLKSTLDAELSTKIVSASSVHEAFQFTNEDKFDVALINTPLTDEFGFDLAKKLASEHSIGVIMLVKNEICDEISKKAEDFGIYVVSKPILKPILFAALKMMTATKKRIEVLKFENILLKNKIEEMKLIGRAKFTLIQYLNMTESAAHRYIEKQAMDMRLTKKQVAIEILKTYEV